MQVPLQIAFHQLEHSDAIAADIRQRAGGLEKFFPRITGMRVSIERLTHRHRKGNLYEVHVTLTLPGGEVAVGNGPGEAHADEDPYLAIHEAFHVARRRLEDYVRIHFLKKNQRAS